MLKEIILSAEKSNLLLLSAALFLVFMPLCKSATAYPSDMGEELASKNAQKIGAATPETRSTLQRFDSSSYVAYDIDVNLDGILDKVVSSAKNAGDDLLFFVRDDGRFVPSLTSINLTEDGGRVLGEIRQASNGNNNDVLVIETYFPQGHDVANHYVSYRNGRWYLSRTELEISDWRVNAEVIYMCDVIQGIPMSSLTSAAGAASVQQIPEESLRQRDCHIKQRDQF